MSSESILRRVEGDHKTPMYPVITRDPVSGEELIVTRLECPTSGVAIEGRFSLGWIGHLTREQLDFVELLVRYRGNVQRLAQEINVAYNTARNRLDEIVDALARYPATDRWQQGEPPLSATLADTSNANGAMTSSVAENAVHQHRMAILTRLAAQDMSVEEATQLLKGLK